MFYMKKIFSILILVVLVSVVSGLFVFAYVSSLEKESSVVANKTSTPAIPINYSNLASVVSKNSMVKAVPLGSTILLKFYNFDSEERAFEKSYIITTGKIVEGEAEADIVLLLHSKYLKGLTNKNFCSVIQKANKNKDLGIETELSSAALAWKFKSMYEYKSCLGM